jgi:Na+-translocating ferredoxin:NAD+ oxidoreductase RnfG subunit
MTKSKFASLKPAIVLTMICVVAALLLAVVNKFTAPKITNREQQALKETFSAVLPGAEGFEELSTKKAPASIKRICKETSGKGYALLLTAQSGYHTLEFSMGIDNEGKITGIAMISTIHSGGNAAFASSLPLFLDSYKGVGKDLKGSVDKVSGATKSSVAMRTAMAEAFSYVETLKEGE